MMDPNTPMIRLRCQELYGQLYLETDRLSDKALRCTWAIVVCTILLEIFANGNLFCCDFEKKKRNEVGSTSTVIEQPQLEPELQTEPQLMSNSDVPTTIESIPEEEEIPSFCCLAKPPPHVRANRLVVSTLLFGFVLTAFIIRIQVATTEPPYISDICQYFYHATPTNWTLIAFLDIIPFICASFAFLRALIDCTLVRWDKGFTYRMEPWYLCWPPLMPLVLGFIVVTVLLELFVKTPILYVMGIKNFELWAGTRKNTGTARVEDIEMQGEEAQGLVDNVDGPGHAEEDDIDDPPAYDEVCHTRASTGRKHSLESMV